MKRIAMAGALLALAVPAAAPAKDHVPTPRENAAKACKQQRTEMGEATFKQTYGTNKNRKNAFGKCVSKFKKVAVEAKQNAAQACKAERDDPEFAASHDGKTFQEHYGTNRNGKNAYGKCVSSKSRAEVAEESEDAENAAKACKAERKDPAFADSHEGKSFEEHYGTNRNNRNAFGKCVSSKVKEQNEAEAEAETEAETETETPAPAQS